MDVSEDICDSAPNRESGVVCTQAARQYKEPTDLLLVGGSGIQSPGNSVVVSYMEYVLRGIVHFLQKEDGNQ